MICNKCGAENLDGGIFCTMCGLPFNDDNASKTNADKAMRKPKRIGRTIKLPAVIAAGLAVVAAVLILLFAVILPRFDVKNRINHVWYHKDDKMELTLDFRNNSGTLENMLKFPIEMEWEVNGDRLGITLLYRESPLGDTEEYIVSFRSGGKVMKWTEVGSPSSVKEFTRID